METPTSTGGRGPGAFNGASTQPEVDLIPLQAKIGQLTLENDFLERALTKAGWLERKAMIDRNNELPLSRRAKLLGISRGQRVLPTTRGERSRAQSDAPH